MFYISNTTRPVSRINVRNDSSSFASALSCPKTHTRESICKDETRYTGSTVLASIQHVK